MNFLPLIKTIVWITGGLILLDNFGFDINTILAEKLVFSNIFLAESVLKNYSEMKRSRVKLNVSVKYETPIEKLREIPRIIENAIKEMDGALFDRAHFSTFVYRQ